MPAQILKFSKNRKIKALMFVEDYARETVNIVGGGQWLDYQGDGNIEETVANLLSHETLHLVLTKIYPKASDMLDKKYGTCRHWVDYKHGLANLLLY